MIMLDFSLVLLMPSLLVLLILPESIYCCVGFLMEEFLLLVCVLAASAVPIRVAHAPKIQAAKLAGWVHVAGSPQHEFPAYIAACQYAVCSRVHHMCDPASHTAIPELLLLYIFFHSYNSLILLF